MKNFLHHKGHAPRHPDTELENLQRRFRKIADGYDRAQKRRAFFRMMRRRVLAWVLGVVAIGHIYIALDLFGPWPPILTVRHIIAYPNCGAANLVGLAPARRGEPGYWDKLDRDKDGISCEPVPAWKTR